MEASLSRLRELFNLDLAGNGCSDPQHLHNILYSLSGLPAPTALQQLREHYLPAVATLRNRLERFQFLEEAQPEIQSCLPVLEKMISDAILPLPAKIGAVALVADNCLKSLTNAYTGIVGSITGRQLDTTLADLLQKAAYRSMQALLRRQMLAYRAYVAPSPASWQHMHDLYRVTRNHGVATLGGDTSIERLYLCALLMAYTDPGKIPRHNHDALRQAIESLTPFAGIVNASEFDPNHASLAGRFLVNTSYGSPGRPLAKAGIHAPIEDHFIIECRGIINALDRKLAQGLEAQNNIPENVLTALRTAMSGQWNRRFSRMQFKPKTSLVAGIGNALGLIGAFSDSKSLDEAMSSASDWDILNESPDGFAIRYRAGPRWQAQAGDLVVLRIPEENRLHICLIRRLSYRRPDKFDLGLQELSPYASLIQLPATEGNASRQAIFLPHLPAFDGSPGLLVRAGCFPPNTIFRAVGEDGKIHLWRRGTHSENNGQVEFHVLAPAENLA